jgi:hypothetical protein
LQPLFRALLVQVVVHLPAAQQQPLDVLLRRRVRAPGDRSTKGSGF